MKPPKSLRSAEEKEKRNERTRKKAREKEENAANHETKRKRRALHQNTTESKIRFSSKLSGEGSARRLVRVFE